MASEQERCTYTEWTCGNSKYITIRLLVRLLETRSWPAFICEAILWTIPTYLHTVCTYVLYVHTYIHMYIHTYICTYIHTYVSKVHLNEHHIKKLMHPIQYCTAWLSGLDISKWPLVLFLTVVVMSHGQNMFWTKWLALNNLSRYPFWRWLTNRRVWVKF